MVQINARASHIDPHYGEVDGIIHNVNFAKPTHHFQLVTVRHKLLKQSLHLSVYNIMSNCK